MQLTFGLCRVLLLGLFVSLSAPVAAQQPSPSRTGILPVPSTGQPPSVSNATLHTLWRASGKGTNSLYLLGSVHVLKAENYPLPHVIDLAFSNSPVVVFETDIAAMDDPQVQLKILGKAQLPPGETLASQLSPAVYTAFTNHVEAAGMPATIFDQLKPSLAAITLSVVEIQRLGFSTDYGLDKHYFDLARKGGRQIIPLETLDFQINLVTDFNKEEGELLLKTTLDEIDQLKKEFPALIKAWENGDSKTLEKLLNDASKEAPVIYKRLLTDRNERWIPKLEELLKGNKNAIAIVGAGHLVGPDGVVELLKKKGWKITQE